MGSGPLRCVGVDGLGDISRALGRAVYFTKPAVGVVRHALRRVSRKQCIGDVELGFKNCVLQDERKADFICGLGAVVVEERTSALHNREVEGIGAVVDTTCDFETRRVRRIR